MVVLLMCGVYYLARKAKIMNPVYTILLPYSLLGVFLIIGNLMGTLPYTLAPASDVRVALGTAGIIMGGVIIYNLYRYNYKYVNQFMPEGSNYMLIPMLLLEIIAYLNRVLSLGLRLFINLAAGKFMVHIVLSIVGASLISLTGIGIFLGFEIMVAYLQCYIFCYISNLKE